MIYKVTLNDNIYIFTELESAVCFMDSGAKHSKSFKNAKLEFEIFEDF